MTMKWNYKLSMAFIGGFALALPMSAFAQEREQNKQENKGDRGRQQPAKTAQKAAAQTAPTSGGQSRGAVRNQGQVNNAATGQGHVSNSPSPESRGRNLTPTTSRSAPSGASVTTHSPRNQSNVTEVTPPNVQTRGTRNQSNVTAITPPNVQTRGTRNQNNVRTGSPSSVQTWGARNQSNATIVTTPSAQTRVGRMNSQQTQAYQQQYNQGNHYGGLWFAGNTHRDWNQNQQYYWNNHNYRWYENGWLIIDGGYDPYYSQTGSTVSRVQSRLADRGYYQGQIDGDIGPGTRNAILNYQSDNGLRVTGRINDSLLASLQL